MPRCASPGYGSPAAVAFCLSIALFSPPAAAQTVSLAVSNIPAAATRVVAAIDGGSLTRPVSFSQDFAAGTAAIVLNGSAPAGGPYRVRAVAVTSDILPAVLSSGQVSGVLAPESGSAGAAITLAEVKVASDPLTPVSAGASTRVTIRVNITDPGDCLSGGATAQFWTSTAPFTANMRATALSGSITSAGVRLYTAAASVTLPANAPGFYYQLGMSIPAFTTPDGLNSSYVIWPNLQMGMSLRQITITADATLTMNIIGIPPSAGSVVAVVDGGAIQGSASAIQRFAPGAASVQMDLGVPGGGPYRVRAVALSTDIVPAVLRGGLVAGLSVAAGSVLLSDLTLAETTAALDPSTPASASAGSTVTVRVNITDPGAVLDGVRYSQFWTGAQPFLSNLRGIPATGNLISLGGGMYQAVIRLTMPAMESGLYYQFGQSVAAFSAPDGSLTSYMLWPNLQAGGSLQQIVISAATGIRLTVSAVPASAGQIVAAVDGGAISGATTTAQLLAPGASSVSMWIGAPPGGPYRVRAVALVNGAIPAVVASGQATNIFVAPDALTEAAAALGPLAGNVDASVPFTAPSGTDVPIRVNIIDPGDFLDGVSTARFWTGTSPFIRDLSGTAVDGAMTRSGPGVYQADVTVTLPGAGTALYFQLGQSVLGFNTLDGLNGSYLLWPALEVGAAPVRILIEPGFQCGYFAYPAAIPANPMGGTTAVNLSTPVGCSWIATSSAPWITISGAGIGAGSASIPLVAAANPGPTISGSVSIMGMASTVVQTGAQTPAAEALATHLYLDVLGRAPDPGGLDYFARAMESGLLSGGQAASQMYTSVEFINLWQLVASSYRAILARDADYQGWLYHTAVVQRGILRPSQVINSFLASSEFTDAHGNTSDADFITILYRNALGREPDPSGFDYFWNALASGAMTRDQVVTAFIGSPEYMEHNGSRLLPLLLYFTLLRRDADPSGLSYYSGLLQSGIPLDRIINDVLASPEYLHRYL